jgi:hypothetical protein
MSTQRTVWIHHFENHHRRLLRHLIGEYSALQLLGLCLGEMGIRRLPVPVKSIGKNAMKDDGSNAYTLLLLLLHLWRFKGCYWWCNRSST